MAREFLPTPIDSQTGLPLPILPPYAEGVHIEQVVNYHHHFFPRQDPRLATQGGRVLRFSRGQILPVWLHNEYHRHFAGPPLPEADDNAEQFRLAVLSCAGTVGPYAVDLMQEDISEPVLLTPAEQRFITSPQRLHQESAHQPSWKATRVNRKIGRFFAAHTVQQELGHMKQATIEEFLETRDQDRKKELGNLLLREAIHVAVEPVTSLERQLQGNGYAQLWGARTVVRRFFAKQRFGDYYGDLARRLRGELLPA